MGPGLSPLALIFPHWSRVTPYTSPRGFAERCVFGKQSVDPFHCAPRPRGRGGPFFRGYGARLPSSFRRLHPRASVCSTSPPVSVCGTGTLACPAAFLGGPFGGSASAVASASPCGAGAFACPAPLRIPRHRRLSFGGAGMFCLLFPSPLAVRLGLRPRLTLGGRTFPRKPRAFGGPDFHRPYRYSCLHPLSRALHPGFRRGFAGPGTLPYHPAPPRGGGIRGFGMPLDRQSFSARPRVDESAVTHCLNGGCF